MSISTTMFSISNMVQCMDALWAEIVYRNVEKNTNKGENYKKKKIENIKFKFYD